MVVSDEEVAALTAELERVRRETEAMQAKLERAKWEKELQKREYEAEIKWLQYGAELGWLQSDRMGMPMFPLSEGPQHTCCRSTCG